MFWPRRLLRLMQRPRCSVTARDMVPYMAISGNRRGVVRLCPSQILRKLASDEHWDVREGVAESRAGCDPDILAELAADDATAVRRAARNALHALGAR